MKMSQHGFAFCWTQGARRRGPRWRHNRRAQLTIEGRSNDAERNARRQDSDVGSEILNGGPLDGSRRPSHPVFRTPRRHENGTEQIIVDRFAGQTPP